MIRSFRPRAGATASRSWISSRTIELSGLAITATVDSFGTVSWRSSSHFPWIPPVHARDSPVKLPPGRARLVASPVPTGSPIIATTIGVVPAAFFAATAPGVL